MTHLNSISSISIQQYPTMASKQSLELSLFDSTNNGSHHSGRSGLRQRRRPTNNNNNNNKPTTSTKKKQRKGSVGISTTASASASAGVDDDKKISSKVVKDLQTQRDAYFASRKGQKDNWHKDATKGQMLLVFTDTSGAHCLKPDGKLPMTQRQMLPYLRKNKLAVRCKDNSNCTHSVNDCMATNCLDYALGNECKYFFLFDFVCH